MRQKLKVGNNFSMSKGDSKNTSIHYHGNPRRLGHRYFQETEEPSQKTREAALAQVSAFCNHISREECAHSICFPQGLESSIHL